jgi:ATP-binding protein involved in chromosome partitioning
MSASPCPHCAEPIALFGSGGGAETARRLGALVGADVPLLAQIPFDSHLRDGGDAGTPAYLNTGDSLIKKTFDELLTALMATRPSLLGVPLSLHT